MQIGRLTRVAQVCGVDVYVHWTVAAFAAAIVAGANRRPSTMIPGVAAYLTLLLLHESGHLFMAWRRGCQPYSMALYPIFGLASFEVPESRLDRALVAWGGVLAQAVVAVPLTLYLAIAGFTPSEPVNAVLSILGAYSLLVAAFNLLPVRPLDGSRAWDLLPAWREQRKLRRNGAGQA